MSRASASPKLVVALVGLPGAGKFAVAECFVARGFTWIELSAVLKSKLKANGAAVTVDNLAALSKQIRGELGEDAVVRLALKDIDSEADESVLIDGIRGPDEVALLRKVFGASLFLVQCFAPTSERHRRILQKAKIAKSLRDAEILDRNSADLGICEPIAFADAVLDLSDARLNTVESQVASLHRDILARAVRRHDNEPHKN